MTMAGEVLGEPEVGMSAMSRCPDDDVGARVRRLTARGTAAGVVLDWLNANRFRPIDPRHIAESIRWPENRVRWGLHVLARSGLLPTRYQPLSQASIVGDWLRKALVDGPVQAAEVKASAAREGMAWRAVQRAAAELGVRRRRSGFGGKVYWSLPATECPG